jgi:hypothetical protein
MIDILLPETADTLEQLLERQAAVRGGEPFNARVMDFVARLSRTVLGDRAFREHPELMAMAHWFRPANLRDLRQQFLGDGERLFLRRGLVFHLAPSNVDSVFIYSWLLALLCGNANIARVSRRRTPQMQAFFAVAARLLREPEWQDLADANIVLSYDHDASLTALLSARCQLRVIWGGDNTINEIRTIPLPPLSAELAFANRFSLAVLSAPAVTALEDEALIRLAQGFYNDAFWFNQQACSSPRALVWIGSGAQRLQAQARFWPAVEAEVQRRAPENLPAQVMDRTTSLFRLALQHDQARAETAPGALPSRILVDMLTPDDRLCHDGNGLFIELERMRLEELAPLLVMRDQTIACFGIERADWLALLPLLPPHAADRIVPIGEALAFSPVWDGVNLLQAFTRELQLKQL